MEIKNKKIKNPKAWSEWGDDHGQHCYVQSCSQAQALELALVHWHQDILPWISTSLSSLQLGSVSSCSLVQLIPRLAVKSKDVVARTKFSNERGGCGLPDLKLSSWLCQDSPGPKFRSCMARLTTKSVRKWTKRLINNFLGRRYVIFMLVFFKKMQHKNLFNL